MFKTTRSGILFIAAVIVSIFLSGATGETSRNFGGDNGQTVGYSIPFKIINEFDINGAEVIFGRYSLVTRGLFANYHFNVAYSSLSDSFFYPVQYLDRHEGIYYSNTADTSRFAERPVSQLGNKIVRVYWYPILPELPEEFFQNLNKDNKVPGKIVVYEMNEIEVIIVE